MCMVGQGTEITHAVRRRAIVQGSKGHEITRPIHRHNTRRNPSIWYSMSYNVAHRLIALSSIGHRYTALGLQCHDLLGFRTFYFSCRKCIHKLDTSLVSRRHKPLFCESMLRDRNPSEVLIRHRYLSLKACIEHNPQDFPSRRLPKTQPA